jgi:phage-related protein
LDVALDANPIGIIILAIVALVAAFVILWTHSAAFRDFWIGAWKDIQGAAMAAWHFLDNDVIHPIMSGIDAAVSFIKDHWQLLATILATVLLGPVAGLVVFLATHWQQVTADVSKMVSDVIGFFTRLPGEMLTIGQNIVHGLVNGIMSMGSFLASSIESLIPSPIRSIVSTALGIFSPSTVFHGFGVNIVQGLINGVRATQGALHATMAGVAGVVSAAGGVTAQGTGSAYAASAVAPAGSMTHNFNVNVNAQGAVGVNYSDPRYQQALQAAVQEVTLRYAGLNPGNGLTPAWGR